MPFPTFTFTFICHPGKTRNHRSRGDTPWKAQTFMPFPVGAPLLCLCYTNLNLPVSGGGGSLWGGERSEGG